jgi:hypothetical protein
MTTFHDRRDGDHVPMGPGSEYDIEARSCPHCQGDANAAIQSGYLDHMYRSVFMRRNHQEHSKGK